jgi:hypothetical protein
MSGEDARMGDDRPDLYSKLDPAIWLPDPQPDDVAGERWSFIGAAGTDWAGCTMTVTVTLDSDDDEALL